MRRMSGPGISRIGLSLRFLLQRLHKDQLNEPVPSGMLRILIDLNREGVLPYPLCENVDIVRWHTYETELGWGAFETSGLLWTNMARLRSTN